jgi:hypothetical protein
MKIKRSIFLPYGTATINTSELAQGAYLVNIFGQALKFIK